MIENGRKRILRGYRKNRSDWAVLLVQVARGSCTFTSSRTPGALGWQRRQVWSALLGYIGFGMSTSMRVPEPAVKGRAPGLAADATGAKHRIHRKANRPGAGRLISARRHGRE